MYAAQQVYPKSVQQSKLDKNKNKNGTTTIYQANYA